MGMENRRSFSAQKLFFGRSRIERRIDTAKIIRQQSPPKLSSSYSYCNCYCNRDSYMKCNNNNNNIVLHLLLLLFAVTVLLHFTNCTLYQHGTLCSSLLFPSLLSLLLSSVSVLFCQCMQIPHTPHTVWGVCTPIAKLDIITRKLKLKKCMQTSREGVLKRGGARKSV